RYSDAVVARWAIRNACVPHRIPRAEVLQVLPLLDQPDRPFEAAYRDRTAARVVRESGGRVLFTGLGGDNLVLGTMFFFADQLWTGQVREALREMIHRAALGRVSFWTLAYRNAVLPLLPARMRAWLMRGSAHGVPVWIAPRLARGLALERRVASAGIIGARRGHQYEDALAAMVAAIPSTVGLGPLEDALDVRHPFLHRPLVELALALPPEFCVRPHARKWVLREATRGIVPEQVRTRIGKGSSDGLDAWSLMHEQEDARRLLRDPILAELGCIEPARLRALIDAVGRGQIANSPATERIRGPLEVEMWLQVRSGRWAADDASRDTARLARGA
ncbi:MAG: hypothetical protein HOQ09_05385, partial [Gemmatimonadaceae bacterium]|nr:hypothetical protein [Gemmatimonadaceae bacterium]